MSRILIFKDTGEERNKVFQNYSFVLSHITHTASIYKMLSQLVMITENITKNFAYAKKQKQKGRR